MKHDLVPHFLPINILAVYLLACGFTSPEITPLETALLKKDYAQVEKLSSQLAAVASSPEVKNQARYYLALSQINLAKYDEAKGVLKQLVKENLGQPLKDKASLALFDAYYLDEDYTNAQDVIQKFIKLTPPSDYLSLIYLKAARVNLKLAQWSKAKECLSNLLIQFPNSLEVHSARQLLEEKQYFAVQVGSFSERGRAEQLVGELKQKGEYAYIVETTDPQNKKFYRVRVGQLALLNEAKRLKTELSQLGYPTQIFP